MYTNLKAGELKVHPDIDGQIQALEKRDLHQVAALMGNVLETVTIPAYPVIQQIKDQMMEYGALNAMMSGSGPTVFGLFEREDKARKACQALKQSELAKQVYLTGMFHGGNRHEG